MKTTIQIGTTSYTLHAANETDLKARVAEITALHTKHAKSRKASPTRNTGGRVFPPNGANVSVREYCEQYYRANPEQYGAFTRETLGFFEPLSVRRCYVQDEFCEEVAA